MQYDNDGVDHNLTINIINIFLIGDILFISFHRESGSLSVYVGVSLPTCTEV